MGTSLGAIVSIGKARAKPKGSPERLKAKRSQTMSMMAEARSTRSCEINVTPLIDVLLVLLIIFMTILPEHKIGEKTRIPQPAPGKAVHPPAPIIIQLIDAGQSKPPKLTIVEADNQEQEVSWEGFEARLKTVYAIREDRVAFVKGDPEVNFEYVAQVVDLSHRAGADRIGLIRERN
jgi:biopolymer transport protein TolR